MHPVIDEILQAHDVLLIDLWGVIWLGGECKPIEGAVDFVHHLQKSKKTFYFLSNTVWPESELTAKFKSLGIELSNERFITAGRVVRENIGAFIPDYKERTCLHAGRPWEVEAYFKEFSLTDDPQAADIILAGDFWAKKDERPSALDQIEPILNRDQPITAVACNPDIKNVQPDGTQRYQSGHFMLEYSKQFPQHDFIFIGKPHLPIYEFAFTLVPDVPKNRIGMIGDTPGTDMAGAAAAGINKILILTGNTKEPPEDLDPDFVIPSYLV
jgi:glycerol 3-phosphatase-2